jgi:hypothetical protein
MPSERSDVRMFRFVKQRVYKCVNDCSRFAGRFQKISLAALPAEWVEGREFDGRLHRASGARNGDQIRDEQTGRALEEESQKTVAGLCRKSRLAVRHDSAALL